MTENECINKIQWRIDIASAISGDGKDGKAFEDLEMAIQALEDMQKLKELGECYVIPKNGTFEINGINVHTAVKELEQYRAIGTVEEIQSMKERLLLAIDMCKDYYAIGTIEEFKVLKAKAEPKEMDRYYCPICRHYFEDTDAYNYCPVCGQKMKSILE